MVAKSIAKIYTNIHKPTDYYEIQNKPTRKHAKKPRELFALCTNPPLAAMISGCLVVVPILGSGIKLLVLFY